MLVINLVKKPTTVFDIKLLLLDFAYHFDHLQGVQIDFFQHPVEDVNDTMDFSYIWYEKDTVFFSQRVVSKMRRNDLITGFGTWIVARLPSESS